MKRLFWLIVLALAVPLYAASAQESEQAPAGSVPLAEEDEDIITVIGERKRDKAMEAFLNGDYVTAEIEFELNLKCAERIEMLEEFAVEQIQSDAVNGEYAAAASQPGMQRGFTSPQDVIGFYNRNPRNPEEIRDRTCDYAAWQLYMAGLSEIQLGKYDEAKKSFYRVIDLSNDPDLFDAHYRIALLELLDGNFDKAQSRLDRLKTLQERCHRKGDRCETRKELDEVVAYLEPTLANARAEAMVG